MNLNRISKDELNLKIQAAQKVVISFNEGINRKTRAGTYITLMSGLASGTYFVGRALDEEADIVEFVG